MTVQELKDIRAKFHLESSLEKENTKFFKACISEGLLPKGLRATFSLAMGVNDVNLVNSMQNCVNMCASGRLDLIYKYAQRKQENLQYQLEEAAGTLSNLIPRIVMNREMCHMKRLMYKDILRKKTKLIKSLRF